MKKYGFSLMIASLWILLSIFFYPETARSQPAGVMRGKVINGTKGGPKVSGAEIFLYQTGGDQEKEKERTKTDREGTFSFAGLPRGADMTYSVRVLYKGVEYFSPQVSFGDKKELRLPLTVYETTDQDTEVSVKMHHVVMKVEDGDLWVQEMMMVENRGDRVYVGLREVEPQKREVLRISLPDKATALELTKSLMRCCIVTTGGGFIDTMDIKPGEKELSFAYKVDFRSSSYGLAKTLFTKTESFNFFITDDGIKAKSDSLKFDGVVSNKGVQYLHFGGRDLGPGSRVGVELSGLPQGKKFIRWGIMGGIVFLFGAGLSLPFLRRKRAEKEGKGGRVVPRPARRDLAKEREALLKDIAHMDGLFQSQQVDPEQYRARRKELKERAIQLTKQLKEFE